MAQQGRYNRNRLIALAVLVLLLILLLILIWWWFFRVAQPTTTTTTPTRPPVETVTLPPQNQRSTTTVAAPRPVSEGEMQLRVLARNFAERYGSWSTDSKYQNLIDLFPRITQRLRSEFTQTIAASSKMTTFKSSQTKVLQINVTNLKDQSADVTVVTQRIETNQKLESTVSYHNLKLTAVKQGEYWYIDTAAWQ